MPGGTRAPGADAVSPEIMEAGEADEAEEAARLLLKITIIINY